MGRRILAAQVGLHLRNPQRHPACMEHTTQQLRGYLIGGSEEIRQLTHSARQRTLAVMTSNSVEELIRTRRATRKYTDQQPTDEVIDRIAELALEAPSAFNAQMRDLIVVRDPAVKQDLYESSGQKQFVDAPVVFIVTGRSELLPDDAEAILGAGAEKVRGFREGRSPQYLREQGIKDAMLVAGFLLIAAEAEGMATSPTTGWDEEAIKEAVGLGGQEDRSVGLVIAAGYPAESPEHPGREANRRHDDRF